MTKSITQMSSTLFVVLVALVLLMVTPQFAAAQEADDSATTTDATVETTDETASSSDETNDDDSNEEAEEESEEEASSIESLLATLQSLMAQVATLQERLAAVRGEVKVVRDEIRADLREGVSSEDVERIQELLATDPELYPEGLVTGYFGSLTKMALQRFQTRHGLEANGEVDDETRMLLEEYLAEGFGENIPPGLLRAPGIVKKVEMRYENGCEKNGRGMGPLCKKLKVKYEDEDGDDDTEEKDEDDWDESELEIEVEVEGGVALVKIEYPNDTEIEVSYDFTTEEALIDLLVEEKDLDRELIESVIEFEYEEDDDDEEENDDEEDGRDS